MSVNPFKLVQRFLQLLKSVGSRLRLVRPARGAPRNRCRKTLRSKVQRPGRRSVSPCFFQQYFSWHKPCFPRSLWSPRGEKMGIARVVAFCFGLIISTLASANVIYQWKTLSTSSTIWSAAGRIEITDAAWHAQHITYAVPGLVYDTSPDCHGLCINYADPTSPIVSFFFTINQISNNSSHGIDVNIHQGTGLLSPIENWLFTDFAITGHKMDLSLYVNTQESDMELMHNTVTRFGSDAPYYGQACSGAAPWPGCSGATGEWLRVPEPASSGLIAFGLIGIAGLGIRRRPLKFRL